MTVDPRVEAMLRADRAEASDLADAEYMAALLAAADAVEGDRPADECEHVYSYTSVDGRWFCADCTPDGDVEPSREAYNDLREAAEDRIIELEDQAKAAEARVVELTAENADLIAEIAEARASLAAAGEGEAPKS